MKNIRTKSIIHRIISLIVIVTILVSVLSIGMIQVSAAGEDVILAHDAVTVNDWQAMFPADSTANAGGVWTDKSVVSGNDELRGQKADDGEFLVGLSAIGSALDLQSEAATATDTVLLLDASSSMGENRAALNSAVNEVIDNLMSLHEENRVAVVFYSSSSTLLMPLGHYRQTRTNTTYSNKYISYSNSRYTVSTGLTKDGSAYNGGDYVSTGNGTNQQSAMVMAMNILNGVTDKSNTPIMVLMSDGEASVANTDYTDGTSGRSISTFNRGAASAQVDERTVTFFTQLAASYVKNKVNAAWNNKFHIFTLCFNTNVALARLLLNPDTYDVSSSNGDITAVQNHWNNYNSTAEGSNYTINDGINLNALKTTGLDMHYVDENGAFEASSGVGSNGLVAAFNEIYKKIVEISELEYVTQIDPIGADLSGYVSFVDSLGKYMKVDKIRGIMLDERLYTGENFAEAFYDANSAFGTIENPTALGDEFVRSIRARLGLEEGAADLAEANARTHLLIQNAYDSGQLFYQNGAYSNYFGWYSDENNKCLGPWDDKTDPDGTKYTEPDISYPGNADKIKYVNKSYLFLGHDIDYNEMYISVRVSREIATGGETVAFGIPASLLPIVRYKVKDDDTTGTLTMEYNSANATPITLFYEVKPGVNKDTLAMVDDAYLSANTSGGKVNFYANMWEDFEIDPTTKIDPAKIGGNTYSYFRPNTENRKYYFEENEYVYYLNPSTNEYEVYTGEATWSVGHNEDTKYYYMEEIFADDGSGNITKAPGYFSLNNHTLLGGHTDDPAGDPIVSDYGAKQDSDGKWYIPKSAIHRRMNHFLKGKTSNTSGTLSNYMVPFVEDTDANHETNTIYACAVLGNNGVAMVEDEATGGIMLSKDYSDDTITDTNASFEFTLDAPGIGNAEVYAYKLGADGTIDSQIGRLTFTQDKATIILKAYESVYIGGLPENQTVKISENPHAQYITDKVSVDGNDTGNTFASITSADGKYNTVLFENKIKPNTLSVLINYLVDTNKTTIDGYDYTGMDAYLAQITDSVIKESKYIAEYNSETDKPLINYIPQVIDESNGSLDGKKYIRTGYTIVEDGTDKTKGIVINEYYAIDELDDPDNNESDGDGIPDKYQAIAEFKSIDDHLTLSPADKPTGKVSGTTVQVFTLKDADGNNAESGKIHPLVKNSEFGYDIVQTKGETGYAFDFWTEGDGTASVNPQQERTVSAGSVITFYANFTPDVFDDPDDNETDGDGIPDKYQAVVKFGSIDDHASLAPAVKPTGTVGGLTTQVFTLTDSEGNNVPSGKIYPLVKNEGSAYVTTTAAEGYAFDYWIEGNTDAPVNPQSEKAVNAGDVVYFWASFAPDEIGDPGDTTDGGDDIPDKYQATVKYVSEDEGKGTVTGSGITQIFTLYGVGNTPATSGKITPSLENVTVKAKSNYTFDGWTVTLNGNTLDVPPAPDAEREARSEDVFVYTAHFTYSGGGGGGGSSNGTLEITKKVTAPEGFDADESYKFILYRESNGARTIYKTLTVKVGQSNRFTLPAGTYYIEEDESAGVDGYNLKLDSGADDNKIVIKRNQTSKLAFENIYTLKSDVPGSDSSSDLLEKDDHHAYIIGYPDGDVRPHANITRAEVATIFFRMMTDEARDKYKMTSNEFTDVDKNDWYNNAISTLSNAGILEGYANGTFRPNEAITRAELGKMAASFYDAQNNNNANFSDIKGHWAEEFLESAYSYGFIDGYPDGTFKPDQLITRAETMKIVNAALERTPQKDHLLDDMIKWPDNSDTSEWYYADVQEATNSHDYKKDDGKEVWTNIRPVRDWAALEKTE